MSMIPAPESSPTTAQAAPDESYLTASAAWPQALSVFADTGTAGACNKRQNKRRQSMERKRSGLALLVADLLAAAYKDTQAWLWMRGISFYLPLRPLRG